MSNKNQPNKYDLLKKAKELDHKKFIEYCGRELKKLEKLKYPRKNDYYRFLLMVNYTVDTGDVKGAKSSAEDDRNIAKALIEYYENKGDLPAGTTDKFES